jgi:acetoin utilization protein AcuB
VLEGRALVGIVSDRDLRGLLVPRLTDEAGLQEIRVRYDAPISELMTADPVRINPESDLSDAVDQMLEHGVGALPVVDEGSGDLLGIVSYVDVLRAVRDTLLE